MIYTGKILKIHLTCFSAVFTLLQLSGAKSTMSLRYACIILRLCQNVIISFWRWIHISVKSKYCPLPYYQRFLETKCLVKTYEFLLQTRFLLSVLWNNILTITSIVISNIYILSYLFKSTLHLPNIFNIIKINEGTLTVQI